MNAAPGQPAVMLDAIGTAHRSARGTLRIVSLVPSLTELVCDLGLQSSLVGRTGFCVHPRAALKSVAKVGGTKDVRIEAVRALEPTHVLVNVDENRRESVEALAQFVPNIVVTHPCMPEDNRNLYRLFGHVFDRAAAAHRLEQDLDAALAEARVLTKSMPIENVLYLIWREPWMTVSRDTYISAMLARVGWKTLPADAVERYPRVDWCEPWLAGLAGVARVLLPSEPYRFRERNVDEVVRLSGRAVARIDGQMTSWYGSRAVAGLRYLVRVRQQTA